MKNIVLLGGGLHVQYCIDIIEKEKKFNIIGITDSGSEIGSSIYDYKVIGRQEELPKLIDEYAIHAGIITIGDNWSRKIVHDAVTELVPDFEFVNAIHPSTIIGKNVKLGSGIVAMAGCIINPNSVIGNFCFFATGAQIEHDNTICDYASVSAGSITGGRVRIGRYSAITLGVTVLDRVVIGENTVVGSGSLVLKDLPDNVLAYGNPAKVMRERELGEKYLKSN